MTMTMNKREVTERDLRNPAFAEGDPSDYEFRADGKIVRKDRFKRGMQDIAAIIFGRRHDYEIDEVVKAVHKLNGVQVEKALDAARSVFENDDQCQQCIDYIRAVIDNPEGPCAAQK